MWNLRRTSFSSGLLDVMLLRLCQFMMMSVASPFLQSNVCTLHGKNCSTEVTKRCYVACRSLTLSINICWATALYTWVYSRRRSQGFSHSTSGIFYAATEQWCFTGSLQNIHCTMMLDGTPATPYPPSLLKCITERDLPAATLITGVKAVLLLWQTSRWLSGYYYELTVIRLSRHCPT